MPTDLFNPIVVWYKTIASHGHGVQIKPAELEEKQWSDAADMGVLV